MMENQEKELSKEEEAKQIKEFEEKLKSLVVIQIDESDGEVDVGLANIRKGGLEYNEGLAEFSCDEESEEEDLFQVSFERDDILLSFEDVFTKVSDLVEEMAAPFTRESLIESWRQKFFKYELTSEERSILERCFEKLLKKKMVKQYDEPNSGFGTLTTPGNVFFVKDLKRKQEKLVFESPPPKKAREADDDEEMLALADERIPPGLGFDRSDENSLPVGDAEAESPFTKMLNCPLLDQSLSGGVDNENKFKYTCLLCKKQKKNIAFETWFQLNEHRRAEHPDDVQDFTTPEKNKK